VLPAASKTMAAAEAVKMTDYTALDDNHDDGYAVRFSVYYFCVASCTLLFFVFVSGSPNRRSAVFLSPSLLDVCVVLVYICQHDI
jgi:hypothetical protein